MRRRPPGRAGQTLAEFALVLPVLLLLIYGAIEFGRLLTIYTLAASASRNAARYATAVGVSPSGTPYYLDCLGMRDSARRATAALLDLPDEDLSIQWDTGTTGSPLPVTPTCNDASLANRERVRTGDRVVVTVTATYRPLLPLGNIPPLPFTFISARTIVKDILGPPECGDGLDNDGDGLADGADGDCENSLDSSEGTLAPDCTPAYDLLASLDPAGRGSLDIAPLPACPAGKHPEGTTVTLVATPNTGWSFEKWIATGVTPDVTTYYTYVEVAQEDKSAVGYLCGVVDSGIGQGSQRIIVDLRNNSSGAARISEVYINWPSGNGSLLGIEVGTQEVWSGNLGPPETTIVDWNRGTVDDRNIPSGSVKPLKFRFDDTNPAASPYIITVRFDPAYGQGWNDCKQGQTVTN